MKMKKLCIALALIATSVIWTSDSAFATDPVHDCSNGCWIVTCSGATCTLWRCDQDGCRVETTFPNQVRGSEADGQWSGIDGGCTTDRCVVKVCGPLECSLYGLEGDRSSLLGRFENSDGHLSEIARAFMESPRRKN